MRKSSEVNKESDCMRLNVSLSFACKPGLEGIVSNRRDRQRAGCHRRAHKIGAEPASGSTEDLARAIKEEQERVAKAVAAAGIKPL
jgi:hypothetical protein